MTSRRNIAVLGCGAWGSNIVRCLTGLGCLRAVADPTPAGRARARELAPEVEVHDRIDAVLADAGVAGVMIASPAATHFALARAALEAGKDVFVEKPMTVDLDDAHELVARADAAQRILMVGHLLEYHPAILRLHELIRSGEFGEIRYIISNRLNLGKIRTEENALWSFAPHDISVILRLVGSMPVQVVATGGCYLRPDIADVTVSQMLFADGVRSHIFVSWLHPFKEQRLVVVGSRKMVSFDDVAKKLILHDQRVDGPPDKPVPVRGDGVEVDYGSEEPLKLECKHFLDCIATRQRPRTDGENGLRVLRILHASQNSLTDNGRPVLLDESGADDRLPPPEVEVARLTTTVHAPVRSS